ncbi:trehalose-6-phosphate hydrolase [Hydra vulgaris]|uniref:Trehalose-6-phosphate hydrolase n=1 Tax=Hydra vulgaris TaxID=6087 RepID=A0ABM4CJF8_HYDVU
MSKQKNLAVDTNDIRSITSIELRKPTKEELKSCRGCRIFCLVVFFAVLLALLGLSIYLIATRSCSKKSDSSRYPNNVTYIIDVKSYNDSNNDGVGDIKGVNLDYFRSLNISTLVLNDVVNNRDFGVDQILGSEDDFKKFFQEAYNKSMAVVLSFNPCTVSLESHWFKHFINSTADEKESWFIVKKPEEITDWRNRNNDSAWYEINNIFYYSYFGQDSPMLNYHNDNVTKALLEKLTEWKNLGASGFLFKHVSRITVDNKFRNNSYTDIFDKDQDTSLNVLKNIYKHVNKEKLGMVWLASTADFFLKNTTDQIADLFVPDIIAQLVIPVDIISLSRMIKEMVTGFNKFSIGWVNSFLDYENLTHSNPELTRLKVLFSLVLPNKVLVYNKEKTHQLDDKILKLIELRTLRHEFQTLPTINCTSSSVTMEIMYKNKIRVVVNFGKVSSALSYHSTVLYSSSSSSNFSLSEKTKEPFVEPFNLLILDV